MFEVAVIDHLADLEAVLPEWEQLLDGSSRATIFQTPDWLLPHARCFGTPSLFVVAVRRAGELIGLAPLEIRPMRHLPGRALQFVGTGLTDYQDFILKDGLEADATDAIFGAIQERAACWDLVDLQEVPPGSPLLAGWPKTFGRSGHLSPQSLCPALDLPPSWDECMSRLPTKTRRNMRYYERHIHRDFQDVFLGQLEAHEVPEGMDAFLDLHLRRREECGTGTSLSSPPAQRFLLEAATALSRQGELAIYGVRLEGKLRAIMLCFVYGGVVYYYNTGFDSEFARYRLGTVLLGHALQGAIEAGMRKWDFLRGNEDYKALWTDTSQQAPNQRLLVTKRSIPSACAYLLARTEQNERIMTALRRARDRFVSRRPEATELGAEA